MNKKLNRKLITNKDEIGKVYRSFLKNATRIIRVYRNAKRQKIVFFNGKGSMGHVNLVRDGAGSDMIFERAIVREH